MPRKRQIIIRTRPPCLARLSFPAPCCYPGFPVSKRGLGKRFSSLMLSPKRAASMGDDASGAKQPPPGGLALILGKKSEAIDLQGRQSPGISLTQKKLLRASLIFADCLLFSLAVWLVFGEGGLVGSYDLAWVFLLSRPAPGWPVWPFGSDSAAGTRFAVDFDHAHRRTPINPQHP